jgi:D-arabinose 5-phosphate isomerase GutQ
MTTIGFIIGDSGCIGRSLARQLSALGCRVAAVMVWRLGERAVRVTGSVIAVDGGFTTVRPLVK